MIAEPITRALTIAGTTLTFNDFTIRGVVGFNLTVLYKGEQSLYEIEKQNFSFQIATSDVLDNEITMGLTFTAENSGYLYTFQLDRPPIPDVTGWSEIHTNLITTTMS